MSDENTRKIALEIIAATGCEGPAGTCDTVGNVLAEAIMKNLEAGGFNFDAVKPPVASESDAEAVDAGAFDKPHRRKHA